MEISQPCDESKVLVIYTGGTIGMLVGPSGYVPEANFLTETLRSQSRFHDPLQDSLFSNSSSVEGFREWSSGRSTPSGTSPNINVADWSSLVKHPTLLVSSSRPIAQPLAPTNSPFNTRYQSRKISDGLYQADLPSLVTPRSTIPGTTGSKRIRYAILEVVKAFVWLIFCLS
jgi:60kDa lysophospholipase